MWVPGGLGVCPSPILGLWKAPSGVRTTKFFASSWGVGEDVWDGGSRSWNKGCALEDGRAAWHTSVSLPKNSYQHSSPASLSRPVPSHFTPSVQGWSQENLILPSCTFLHSAHLRQVSGSPVSSGATMYQMHHVDVGLEREQRWPWLFHMTERQPTLKQAPGPAESAPGITNKRPDNTLVSLLPNTWLPSL